MSTQKTKAENLEGAKSAYHHGDLRRGLLDAADLLLEEKGLQGFTLRACARLANVSHAAPKHHFGDVKGLMSAVAERGFARLVQKLREEISKAEGNLDEEMVATARAYVEFAESNPEHFRIMFRADLIEFDLPDGGLPRSVQNTFLELTNVILRQRGEVEIEVDEVSALHSPAVINDIIIGWGHIHGYAHLRLEGQLNMIAETEHLQQLRGASLRLAQLIQSQSTPIKV